MIDVRGSTSLWALPPWTGGPCLYKQAEQATHGSPSKQLSSIAFASAPTGSCFEALPRFPWTMDDKLYYEIHSFFPKLLLGVVFSQ